MDGPGVIAARAAGNLLVEMPEIKKNGRVK